MNFLTFPDRFMNFPLSFISYPKTMVTKKRNLSNDKKIGRGRDKDVERKAKNKIRTLPTKNKDENLLMISGSVEKEVLVGKEIQVVIVRVEVVGVEVVKVEVVVVEEKEKALVVDVVVVRGKRQALIVGVVVVRGKKNVPDLVGAVRGVRKAPGVVVVRGKKKVPVGGVGEEKILVPIKILVAIVVSLI